MIHKLILLTLLIWFFRKQEFVLQWRMYLINPKVIWVSGISILSPWGYKTPCLEKINITGIQNLHEVGTSESFLAWERSTEKLLMSSLKQSVIEIRSHSSPWASKHLSFPFIVRNIIPTLCILFRDKIVEYSANYFNYKLIC